ncbi:DNA topoisomerase (ATP-hydrolyzing) [Ranunculus cassubicifolius]
MSDNGSKRIVPVRFMAGTSVTAGRDTSSIGFLYFHLKINFLDESALALDTRLWKIQAKNALLGKKTKASTAKGLKGRGEASFFRVTCKDNGKGMPHDDIPNMFGRVLSGTKYSLKQTRGKFGLGAKMTPHTTRITTHKHKYLGDPDLARLLTHMRVGIPSQIQSLKNIPHIHLHEKRDNKERWHGAEIQVVIEGNWTTYRSKILHYMRQMAVITPYAQFLFKFVSDTADKSFTVRFARRTDIMPPIPAETKYHPSAVDLLLIKRLITETSKQNLSQFLQHEFVNLGKSHAERLIGEYNLRLGIVKELHPDMVATYSGSAQVFEGHPFIVEAGVSLGGKDVKQGLNIFRFANRIPLLFEQGADVVTRTAMKRINWSSYKINQTQDKIGVFVSIVSTKIPFKGTGKEYIGDDISEIASAVKVAIQQCCVQLKSKIAKKIQAREQQERKRNLSKYIPDVTNAIYEILRDSAQQHTSKKRRYEEEDAELLRKVSAKIITKELLKEKLAEHVEKVDYEMALDYAMQSGVSEEPREPIYIQALEDGHNFIDLHNTICVLRLFKDFL